MTPRLDAFFDDRVARARAVRDAALAYRALTGPVEPFATAAALAAHDARAPAAPAEAPLVLGLVGWASGRAAAVDEGRARRLFWLHFAGEAFCLEAWPDLGPVLPSCRLPGQATVPGHWPAVGPALPRVDVPAGPLETRWPTSVAVLLATHTGLLPALGGPPGRIRAAPEPGGDDGVYMKSRSSARLSKRV